MKTEQIEKAMRRAAKDGLTVEEFGAKLGKSPFDLLPAEATKTMYEFRRRFYNVVKAGPTPDIIAVPHPPLVKTNSALRESNYKPMSINRSAVKEFALAVSQKKKGGKFNRVSVEFIQSVEAEVENFIRSIGAHSADSEDDIESCPDLLNRLRVMPKIIEQLNRAVRRLIFRKVLNHPSQGKTLK